MGNIQNKYQFPFQNVDLDKQNVKHWDAIDVVRLSNPNIR